MATVQVGMADRMAVLMREVSGKVGGPGVSVRLMQGQRRLLCHEQQADVRLTPGSVVDVICQPVRVVTGCADGLAMVWSEGQCKDKLLGHSSGVLSVVALRGSDIVATGSSDSTARLWDAGSGECLQIFQARAGVNSVEFSPDGVFLLGGCGDGTAIGWGIESGLVEFCLAGHAGGVHTAAFSPDGQLVVTASADRTAKIWHAAFAECMETLSGHRAIVRAASFSPDGSCAVTCSWDRMTKIWDILTGTCVATLRGHSGDVLSAVFYPEGKGQVLTASADSTARVWQLESAETLLTLEGHTESVRCARFSPDGRAIATASSDSTARLWDAETGECFAVLDGHAERVTSVAFVGD